MSLIETIAEKVIGAIFSEAKRFFKRKRKLSLMTNSVDIHSISKGIVTSGGLSVDFFYLMLAYNGAKRTTKFKFWNVVSGYHSEWLLPMFKIEDYRKVPVDNEYAVVLTSIALNKEHTDVPHKMPTSKLWAAYMYNKLKYVRYYKVSHTDEGMWYIMAGSVTASESDFDDPDHVHRIGIAINKLAGIIKNI